MDNNVGSAKPQPQPQQQSPATNSNLQQQQPIDDVYKYNKKEQQDILTAKPWEKDANYFKEIRVSALALLKMVMHARSGGNLEVMGLILGKVDANTMIAMDSFALPVEGTETRVNAQAQAYEYMAAYTESAEQVGRLEKVIGWYHSHPGYGCWLSGIDVSTQMLNQQFQEPFVAIVIDPIRTISSGKVNIGAFRTYPKGYKPPEEGPSEYQTIPLNKIEDFGVHCKQYYSLDVSYFKSSLDNQLLDSLWNKYWVHTLSSGSGSSIGGGSSSGGDHNQSSSTSTTNQSSQNNQTSKTDVTLGDFTTQQVMDLGDKLEAAESSVLRSSSIVSHHHSSSSYQHQLQSSTSGSSASGVKVSSSSSSSATQPTTVVDGGSSSSTSTATTNTSSQQPTNSFHSFPSSQHQHQDKLSKATRDSCKTTIEAIHGLMSQILKDSLFNFKASASGGAGASSAVGDAKANSNDGGNPG